MLLYLAGPMTGYPNFNFPAFERAVLALRQQNYVVWSPHESDAERKWAEETPTYNPAIGDPGRTSQENLSYFLAYDLPHVCAADGVAVLPGWQTSRGARIETYVAFQLGIPVANYVYGDEFYVNRNVVGRYEHPDFSREP